MVDIRAAYRRLDEWVGGFSRGTYAVFVACQSALGVLAVGAVLGEANYAFAMGFGGTKLVLTYLSDPNHREE
ncbi:hypothetical protein [Natrinema gari]|uniref:Uncharacterized protein n=1 Tax=Natrinema gari JCM 14663 TaxID=1230459 RepID=L9Z111_9EURY|nr:hypothetical protein [Natrinema gari]ELY80195.1 hypothetical protein C486_09325 [Natrinema gari JCM 14663]